MARAHVARLRRSERFDLDARARAERLRRSEPFDLEDPDATAGRLQETALPILEAACAVPATPTQAAPETAARTQAVPTQAAPETAAPAVLR